MKLLAKAALGALMLAGSAAMTELEQFAGSLRTS